MAGDNGSNSQKNGRKRLRGWGFIFLGESSNHLGHTEDIAQELQKLTESELVTSVTPSFPLTKANVGDWLQIVRFRDKGSTRHLLALGLRLGTELTVISRARSGSVIVTFQDNRIGLGAAMAEKIWVTNTVGLSTNNQAKPIHRETNTYLCNLPVGSRGRIVGYEQVTGGYKGRLLAMGLTPGTGFTLIGHAPDGDWVEIEVRGLRLSLRKHEADVLCIEEVNDDCD
jgi:ferrous iron transport protein A